MKTSNTSKNTSNTSKTDVKVIPMSKTMTTKEIEALKAALAASQAALAAAQSEKAALAARINTSKNRAVKAPDSYDIFQPLSVTIRGNINQGIVDNNTLIKLHESIASQLSITLDNSMCERIYSRTVLHNSLSNLAKAKDEKGIESRDNAFKDMTQQGKILYGLSDSFIRTSLDTFDAKAVAALNALKK